MLLSVHVNKALIILIFSYTFAEVEDWNDVIIACSSLAGKWQQLTGFLGLSFQQIREIKKNNCNDSADSWNEALMMWISQEYNTRKYGLPSWQSLLRTINGVDQALCEKLAREHQVKGTIAYECRHRLLFTSITVYIS